MKKLLTLTIFLIVNIGYGQNNNDVRNVNWDMTIEEVINSEKPLVPSKKSEEIIEFKNVFLNKTVNEEFYADIEYHFKNRKLWEVNYTIRLKDKGKWIIPFSSKVEKTKFVINALISKGFECRIGWHHNFISPKERIKLFGSQTNCSLDREILKQVEQHAKDKNATVIWVNYESERSYASLTYHEGQNGDFDFEKENARKSNIICKVKFEPNFEVSKEMQKSGF